MFIQRKQAVLDEVVDVINNYYIPHFVELNFGKEIEARVVPGQLSDSTIDMSNKIIQKLVEMDKVKVERSWLVEKTGVPFEYRDEMEMEEKPEIEQEVKEEEKQKHEEGMKQEDGTEKKDDKETKMAEDLENSDGKFWRAENGLEKKYNLARLDSYLTDRQLQFMNDMATELQFQTERIKRYVDKNWDEKNYTKIVAEIEVKRSPIKKILQNFLYDVYEYVMRNFQQAIEMRFGEIDNFIGFRIDIVTDKIVKDLETAIKLQVGNDMAAMKSKIEVTDRIGNTTLHSFLTSRMPVIAETEIGFILNKSVDSYIKQNLDAVKKGILDAAKEIKRVRYSAIMDNKVCAMCQKLDGTVVEVNSAVYFRYNPPIHYNCRCVWLPITVEEIADPRQEYTDLTVNEKGRPVSVEDIARKLGDDSLLKTFCECSV